MLIKAHDRVVASLLASKSKGPGFESRRDHFTFVCLNAPSFIGLLFVMKLVDNVLYSVLLVRASEAWTMCLKWLEPSVISTFCPTN